jgi:hypothetical protein
LIFADFFPEKRFQTASKISPKIATKVQIFNKFSSCFLPLSSKFETTETSKASFKLFHSISPFIKPPNDTHQTLPLLHVTIVAVSENFSVIHVKNTKR